MNITPFFGVKISIALEVSVIKLTDCFVGVQTAFIILEEYFVIK